MISLFSPLFLLSLILASTALRARTSFAASNTLLLPIVKDNTKPQYYTSLQIGTRPTTRIYLAIDLTNLWSWFTCDIVGYNRSSTFHNVPCRSPKCESYGGIFCSSCNAPLKPSCTNDTCGAEAYSPQSTSLYAGGLIEDVITLYRGLPKHVSTSLRNFPFTCTEKGPLKGLSSYTKGILTLARRSISLHAQISSTFKVPHKFALCLPSFSTSKSGYNGAMYFGGGPYNFPYNATKFDFTKSLVTTPLVINPNSTAPIFTEGDPSIEYFINVKSINVDGTALKIRSSLLSFDKDGIGGTKISTIDPYMKLHSQIYNALIDVFVTKASKMNITRVAGIPPFGACFNGKTVKNTKTGPIMPIIDLILDGKNAKWRIYGSNSVVKLPNKEVLCLAIVDGGSTPRTSIVIGGKQMEDNLVEFDLEADKLGITSSLLQMGTTCSQFKGI